VEDFDCLPRSDSPGRAIRKPKGTAQNTRSFNSASPRLRVKLLFFRRLRARPIFGEPDLGLIKELLWVGASSPAGPFFVADDMEAVVPGAAKS
jgi:hypothetical protein